MNDRPHPVSVLSAAFIAAGTVGLIYHGREFRPEQPLDIELIGLCFVRLLAIVGGVATLRAKNWGRWLLVLWLGFHVVLSALHSFSELLVHAVLLALVVYCLFRADASAYFRAVKAAPAPG